MNPSQALDGEFYVNKLNKKSASKKKITPSKSNLFFNPEDRNRVDSSGAFKGKFFVKQSEILVRKPKKPSEKYIELENSSL